MANADRISEVYKGELWDKSATQRRARDRVHWLCKQAKGLVLDVGCSQGIASLLLARDGFQVVGVDVELDRLEYAENDRRQEPRAFSRRAHFVGADATRLPFADDRFDTVLLGEVLEHLVNPASVLSEVARVLSADGTVAITVPFGYHPHHDHKTTFYPHSLLELIASHLTPTDLEFAGRHMRLTATSHSSDAQAAANKLTLDHQWKVESTFLEAEETLGDTRRRAQELEQRVKDTDARLRQAEKKLEHEIHRLKQASEQIERLQADNSEAKQQIERLQADNSGAKQQIERLQADNSGAKQQIERLQADKSEVEARLRRASESVVVYKQRITKLNHDRHKLRHRIQIANWKVLSLRSRKWWRIGRAIRDALKRPWRIVILPVELVKIAFGPSALPPRPEESPYREAYEASLEGPADSNGKRGNKGKTRSGTRESASTWTEREPATTRQMGRSELEWPAGIRSVPKSPGDLWVAAIMDDMSAACFGPECNVLTFRPDNWRDVLSEIRPHMLMVESAWSGNQGSWQYKVASYTHSDSIGLPDLKALVEWCRDRDIPTVFWNKEDPVHFDRFKEAAALFDFVFTTDADCVGRYQQLSNLRAQLVDVLPFAAQPKLHNPIALAEPRHDAPCFAGTYYRKRHADRREQLEMILDAARPFGLVIYDRTYGTESDEFGFPDRFQDHIVGRLPYEELARVYKAHKVFLNTNSVTTSPTMFSRRVFELLASGTAVISTPSEGMTATFNDLVPTATSEDEARHIIDRLLNDDAYRTSLTTRAVRHVLSKHTYRERLATVANAVGYEVDPSVQDQCSVVVLIDDGDQWTRLVEELQTQTCQPQELIVGTKSPQIGEAFMTALQKSWPSATFRMVDQGSLNVAPGDRYRELAGLAVNSWVVTMSPTHSFPPTFLEDLLIATRFTDADIIGMPSEVGARHAPSGSNEHDLGHRFVDAVYPLGCLVRRDLISGTRKWPIDVGEAEQTMPQWRSEGLQVYAANLEGFVPSDALATRGIDSASA